MEKLEVSNKTLKNINLTSDYKEAIAQYVWNSFDASATRVEIQFNEPDEIGHIDSFRIQDDGHGIDNNELKRHFGLLLDSAKQRTKESSAIRGGKGRGRFSFFCFSPKAVWHTKYKDAKDETFAYDITITTDTGSDYDPTKPKKVSGETGTVVEFFDPTISAAELESQDLKGFLSREFGWFLFLHAEAKYEILINGKKLDYTKSFADSKSFTEKIKSKSGEEFKFKIDYIRWLEKPKEDNYFYYLKGDKEELFKDHTSYNKTGGGAYGFFHSVYISSDYFDDFDYRKATKKQITALTARNLNDETFKKLDKKLKKFLKEKRNDFYRVGADVKLQEFKEKKSTPEFTDDKYGLQREEDFEIVFKEIYLIEPTIFYNLNPAQEKSLLSMLGLLLESDERENILKIIDSVVTDLDKEDREHLAKTLQTTSLKGVVRTIKMLEDRLTTVEMLKTLVFQNTTFTNERDHIQQIIESNYWLFGEQFHLVSADKHMEKMLANYMAFMDTDPTEAQKKKFTVDSKSKKRRSDIFICQQRKVPDSKYSNDDELEENIIVELKRPEVVIDTPEYRQIEDYMELILNEPQFNSKSLRTWKFYVVGINITDSVRAKYKSFEHLHKRFLVNQVENYEVYALTWDDLFKAFDTKHRYLFDKLEYDKGQLLEGLNLTQVTPSKKLADELTEKMTAKK
jgi:hypothetical protein